ncbi:MAG: DUF4783 domain-containing protein [Bacteroidales bacterium]|nr:DUF4783 domain-containing protein [Bacteroidales bacterium]
MILNLLIGLVLLIISNENVFCQATQKDFTQQISFSFCKSNIKTLIQYFNNNIEIYYNNSSQIYSKTQSENFFNRFFQKNIPSEFIIIEDNKKDFLLGNLYTSEGIFKVEIYYHKEGKTYKINQIRFVKME